MIQAIVFDVDDTLYDQQQPFKNAVNKMVPNFDPKDMPQLYIRFRLHSDELFPKVLTGEWDIVTMRNYRIQQSLKDLGYQSLNEKQALRFQKIYEDELDNITLHPEIYQTLNFLKAQNVPMGIITNGPTDHQYKKVKQLGLLNWIDPENIIISEATGFQKPEAEIFQLAQEQFEMDADSTLYVGDSFENDMVGAKSCDWQALWFNHRLRDIPADASEIFDLEITSFKKLRQTICGIFAPITVKM